MTRAAKATLCFDRHFNQKGEEDSARTFTLIVSDTRYTDDHDR